MLMHVSGPCATFLLCNHSEPRFVTEGVWSLLILVDSSRTVAITPSKSKKYPFEEVKRVCYDSTIKGFSAMTESRSKDGEDTVPFRFLYMSGMAAERDPAKKPDWMPEYALMRVSTFLLCIRNVTRIQYPSFFLNPHPIQAQ